MIGSRRDELIYLAGRAAALGSRPIYLLICNHFFGNAVAAVVASVFLISAMLNALSAFDAHRLYYARHFGGEGGSVARAFGQYIHVQFLVGMLAALAGALYFGQVEHSLWLALFGGLFVTSERLADEVLRFTIFERSRGRWGWLMIGRVAVQMGGIAIVVAARPASAGVVWFVAALLAGNLATFGRYLPRSYVLRSASRSWLFSRHATEAVRLISRSGLLWLLSLATMLSGYLDRIIVLAASKSDLAVFSLIVVSLSVVQNAVEYFYFSQRRRDFLEGSIRLGDVIKSRFFLMIVSSSLAIGIVLTFVMAWLYRGGPDVPILVIMLVAIEQVTIAVSNVVREIAYWNNRLNDILRAEIVFFLAVSAIFAALLAIKPHFGWLLLAGVVALIVRLFLLARIPHQRLGIA